MDEEKLGEFVHRFIGDLGATLAAGSVVVGDRLGLYRMLARKPMGPEDLARLTGTTPRYVEEWLRGQAAGGYVQYDVDTGRYWMTEEQAFALTDPDGPFFAPGVFQLALGALRAEPKVTEAFRTGEGIGWQEQDDEVFAGGERFFRNGYAAQLLSCWLPALAGVESKLRSGARVADVGCGHGASTIVMARAFPQSTFIGFDDRAASIDTAVRRAADAGLDGRVSFEVADAQEFRGAPYDLVATFDCLHDLGDPLRAAEHVHESLVPDGTWMIVEPFAGTSVADNLNPVGRVYYAASTFLCVPHALSQPGGYSLGAQAGEEPVRRLSFDAGFDTFRRVAETPFHLVYEARPYRPK